MAKIIDARFSVGKAHPLYGKTVKAEVLSENCGYDGRQIYARTVDDVLFEGMEANVFDRNGKFLRTEKVPSYAKKWEGYIEV